MKSEKKVKLAGPGRDGLKSETFYKIKLQIIY